MSGVYDSCNFLEVTESFSEILDNKVASLPLIVTLRP
jgi:hypothetical protein